MRLHARSPALLVGEKPRRTVAPLAGVDKTIYQLCDGQFSQRSALRRRMQYPIAPGQHLLGRQMIKNPINGRSCPYRIDRMKLLPC